MYSVIGSMKLEGQTSSLATEAKIVNIAICGDVRVKDKKLEKIEKYQLLREEIGKLWKLTKVTVVPIVNGTSGAVSDMFEEYIGKA